MQFSVLMSIYYKEKADFLDDCLKSIYSQSLLPCEVVIVEDGPLTESLYNVLDGWQMLLPIKRVVLQSNVGLGRALNEGLACCEYDIVARMDTDDICTPKRFEKQIYELNKRSVDVCGSWVGEFESSCEIIRSYRKTPNTHTDVINSSKLKNPVNHPSVMYRKSSVLAVGGYDDVLYFEDYHLWLKLMDYGAKFYNIEEPLVLMRAGNGQLSRRGGIRYAVHELSFFMRSGKEEILPWLYVITNVILRFPIRVLPKNILGVIYKCIRGNL